MKKERSDESGSAESSGSKSIERAKTYFKRIGIRIGLENLLEELNTLDGWDVEVKGRVDRVGGAIVTLIDSSGIENTGRGRRIRFSSNRTKRKGSIVATVELDTVDSSGKKLLSSEISVTGVRYFSADRDLIGFEIQTWMHETVKFPQRITT